VEFTLLIAAAGAVAALRLVLYYEAPRGNAAVGCASRLFDAGLSAMFFGVLIGRLWAMVAAGTSPLARPFDVLLVRGGVATGPATVAALITFAWIMRDDLWWAIDSIAPAAVAGLAAWHAGCLATGACLGTTTTLPWAMTEPASSVGRHPTELYAALTLTLVAATLVVWKMRTRPVPGVLGAIGFTAAAATRLATEPLRLTLGSPPTQWYILGIVSGVALIIWRQRTTRAEPSEVAPAS
jgi:prolipoprotein diacylglyceryltransferase